MDDFFAPEIDSDALHHDGSEWANPPIAWTGDNAATMQYDDYKVQAVINWIDGFNHQRTDHPGTPAIFGMNFQTVSTAEKLPSSDGLTGGYYPGTTTPGPLLQRALNYTDGRRQPDRRRDRRRRVDELRAAKDAGSGRFRQELPVDARRDRYHG
jgi:hypothetical protein